MDKNLDQKAKPKRKNNNKEDESILLSAKRTKTNETRSRTVTTQQSPRAIQGQKNKITKNTKTVAKSDKTIAKGKNNNATVVGKKAQTIRKNVKKASNKQEPKIDKPKRGRKAKVNEVVNHTQFNQINSNLLADAVHVSVTDFNEEDLLDYVDDVPNDDELSTNNSDEIEECDLVVPAAQPTKTADGTSTCSTLLDQEQLLANPDFSRLLQKLVDDKVERKLAEQNQLSKQNNDKNGTAAQTSQNTPKRGNRGQETGRIIKSPSDTTLYTPALNRVRAATNMVNGNNFLTIDNNDSIPPENSQEQRRSEVLLEVTDEDQSITDKISKFVENIHLNSSGQQHEPGRTQPENSQQGKIDQDQQQPGTSFSKEDEAAKLQEARDRAHKIILDAERFKALVEQPKGNDTQLISLKTSAESGITDDEFFHLTCHIDMTLKSKIEKGEFIELEKLLPRDRVDRQEGRMELINKDGQTYFVPYDRDAKISNVRKWEQAFRIYAAIYSAANPSRAAEIWQYVYVINSAAATYVWDDVAHYDYVFRQLMSANSSRSWAKTYTQMWQMTMRTHIPHRNNFRTGTFQAEGDNASTARKTRNCWKFNKGRCNDPSCKFPHKCNYCDGRHGIYTCFKKEKHTSGKKFDNNQKEHGSSPKNVEKN